MTDEKTRAAIRLLKERFTRWRTPPVELPAEHVINEVVEAIAAEAERAGYRRGLYAAQAAVKKWLWDADQVRVEAVKALNALHDALAAPATGETAKAVMEVPVRCSCTNEKAHGAPPPGSAKE
jgi:uncharacterized membrane protein